MANKMILKNPTTGQHYSLADKTLINLPSTSNKNMILWGIEQGKEIQLDAPFDKIDYVNETSVATTKGQIFTQNISKTNTLNIEEPRKNFKPNFTWYETNMTSNTTPVPLVASASSIFAPAYDAYMAFNGLTITAGDGWASALDTTDAHVTLDYGNSKEINCVQFQYMNNSDTTFAPKNIIVSSSNDNMNWKEIGNFSNLSFTQKEIKTFSLQEVVSRYFKIKMFTSNGANYIAIGEITFGKMTFTT